MQTAAGSAALDPATELAKNVLQIEEVTSGRYRGPGWDRLIADANASQFFVIGEQHGTADIANFAIAVHRALASNGYTHAGYEVGPYSMDFAEQLIRSGNGVLASYISRPGNGFSFPFLFFQEENDLAEQIVAASPDKADVLWGLDQEFVGSAPIVAELLRGWATNASERDAIAAFSAKAAANPQLIGAVAWSDMAPLESAFAANARARDLVAALKLSNEIYAPFTGRGGNGYDANLKRETYMKTNFAQRFAAAERRNGKPPKVLLKFGGYHAQRGITGTNVSGLANFLAEWGLPRGHHLTNMMVECVGGKARNPVNDEAVPCPPYFSQTSAVAQLAKPDRLTLVDLRPLRRLLRRMPGLDQESRHLILAFDYYLAIKDVTAATPVAARPGH